MPAILAFAQQQSTAMKAGKHQANQRANTSAEIAQAFQAFGLLSFKNPQASALMKSFIPKNAPYGVDARTAAIWALGMLNAGSASRELIDPLAQRVNDMSPMAPESDKVRVAAAVAIGRIKPEKVPAPVMGFADPKLSGPELAIACRWTIQQITGEPQPPLEPAENESRQWFLTPLKN